MNVRACVRVRESVRECYGLTHCPSVANIPFASVPITLLGGGSDGDAVLRTRIQVGDGVG